MAETLPITNDQDVPNVLLRTEHLTRSVGGVIIVNDVSIEVRRGEVLAIVGPSGSGKTSLLRLINRLDEPTAGTIFVEGTDYRNIPPRELRRNIGMVMQRAYLFPGTVADNICFGPAQRGEKLSQETIEALLRRVGVPGYANRDVINLSGGEAQRVSIARALANSPMALLMDEPTSALDDEAKLGVELLIREIIQDKNLTCMIVTHDTAQAARLADRALVIQAGHAVRIGPVKEVLHASKVL